MQRIHRGFTFIEVIMVLAVLALLAGLAVPMIDLLMTESREDATLDEMQRLVAAIEAYRGVEGNWPPVLNALIPDYISPGAWEEDFRNDEWLNPYQFLRESDRIILYSYGRDEEDDAHLPGEDLVLIINTDVFDLRDNTDRLAVLERGLLAYYDDCHQFPADPAADDCEHLRQLVANTFGQAFWNGPYITDLTYPDLCNDGWATELEYELDCLGNPDHPNVCLNDSRTNQTVVSANQVLRGKRDYTKARLGAIELAIQEFMNDCGLTPPTLDVLVASPTPPPGPTPTPPWSGPYVNANIIDSGDAWSNTQFIYKAPYVYSSGPNRFDESLPPAYGGDDVYP
ncbi:type II secretion system protein GspG [bacterium]|nr:type II secretion system protein GspG [candidate division CSSED10-310 bacterium]